MLFQKYREQESRYQNRQGATRQTTHPSFETSQELRLYSGSVEGPARELLFSSAYACLAERALVAPGRRFWGLQCLQCPAVALLGAAPKLALDASSYFLGSFSRTVCICMKFRDVKDVDLRLCLRLLLNQLSVLFFRLHPQSRWTQLVFGACRGSACLGSATRERHHCLASDLDKAKRLFALRRMQHSKRRLSTSK